VEPRTGVIGSVDGEPQLLGVEALRAEHRTRRGVVVAAEDVTFSVAAGECVALVGESGSGKTTIARCVVGLHAPAGGRILLSGNGLSPLARDRSREERRRVQIVFQNPYDSLNPRRSVDDAVSWPIRSLRGLSAREAGVEVKTLLERVRLPERTARRFPGELSGGERQRVAIARALAARPSLLVCDEVTSALDVSVQAAVLDLLAELRRDLDLSLLFITHDLGVVASVGDRVLVLEAGVIVEEGTVEAVVSAPREEYTRRLVAAAPSLAVDDGRKPAEA
jgi:peptide/nickel transport system ATP-binding protein